MRALARSSAAWTPFVVVAATFGLEWALSALQPTLFDNYVWLADAWLHGHLWIHFPGDWIDAVPFHGRAYVVEAPLPAVLMLPLVAVFGTDANETLLSAILAAIATGAAWALALKAGAAPWVAVLLTAFFAVGTDVVYCGITGDVWLLAHVSAVCFTTLCLVELFGRRRGWVVAACAIAAAFSRYPLLLALPVYALWFMWPRREQPVFNRTAAARGFLIVAVPAFALWSWYNLARWGTPLDVGYTVWYHVMDPRSNKHDSTLSLSHLSQQLQLFFATPPRLSAEFPWVAPHRFGTSLTFLCPGLLVAFAAPWREARTRVLWLLTIVAFVPSLLYYDIGGLQLGTRHALDFEPFLYGLIALAFARGASWWKLLLVGYSTLAGAWMLFVWRFVQSAVF